MLLRRTVSISFNIKSYYLVVTLHFSAGFLYGRRNYHHITYIYTYVYVLLKRLANKSFHYAISLIVLKRPNLNIYQRIPLMRLGGMLRYFNYISYEILHQGRLYQLILKCHGNQNCLLPFANKKN